MPPLVQVALLVGSVAAFALLAATLRARRTWPAALLLIAPVTLALPLADLATAGLGHLAPVFTMDGGSGDGWRFGFVFFVVLCAVELTTQRLLTVAARTGTTRRPVTDPTPLPVAPPLPEVAAPLPADAAVTTG